MANNNIFRVRLTGTRPLLLSSRARRGKTGKQLKKLNEKRELTDTEFEERRQLKYVLALYYANDIGVFVPAHYVWAAGKEAAKLHKFGEKWKQGVQIAEDRLPLHYDGPRSPKGLYADPRFVDLRVVPLKARIEAIRPIFSQWRLEATVLVDDEFHRRDRREARPRHSRVGNWVGRVSRTFRTV